MFFALLVIYFETSKILICLSPLKAKEKSSIFSVFKFLILFILIKLKFSSNICDILFTFFVLKLYKSRLIMALHCLNMPDILITFSVLKLFNSIEERTKQYWNIFDISITFFVSNLSKLLILSKA